MCIYALKARWGKREKKLSRLTRQVVSGLKHFVNNELTAVTKLRSALSLHVSICEEISQRRGLVRISLSAKSSIWLSCRRANILQLYLFVLSSRILTLSAQQSKTYFRELTLKLPSSWSKTAFARKFSVRFRFCVHKSYIKSMKKNRRKKFDSPCIYMHICTVFPMQKLCTYVGSTWIGFHAFRLTTFKWETVGSFVAFVVPSIAGTRRCSPRLFGADSNIISSPIRLPPSGNFAKAGKARDTVRGTAGDWNAARQGESRNNDDNNNNDK